MRQQPNEQMKFRRSLFDYMIRPPQHRRRDREPERLGGLELGTPNTAASATLGAGSERTTEAHLSPQPRQPNVRSTRRFASSEPKRSAPVPSISSP